MVSNKIKIRSLILIVLASISISFMPCERHVFSSPIKDSIVKEFVRNKEQANYQKEQLVVRLDNNNYQILEEKYDLTIEKLGSDNYLVNYNPDNYTLEEILTLLNKEETVTYAEPDYKFSSTLAPTTEPYYNNQWAYTNVNYGINIAGIWDKIEDREDVIVAVLDTGINYNHPDLSNQIWHNTLEIVGNGLDDDHNSYIDDYRGWNFADGTNEVMDTIGHGSHISGIIAGEINDVGIAGMSSNVKIMPLKVSSSSGEYYLSDVLSAIEYALDKGVKIFNFSFGGYDYSQSFKDTLNEADALFICAAGNGGDDEIGDNNDVVPFYPASYDLDNIISVAASNANGKLTMFSNYGLNSVDLIAPGISIYSSHLGVTYQEMTGTSMAAPFVAGLGAILYSENSSVSILDLKNQILSDVKNIPSLASKIATSGLLDVATAYDDFTAKIIFDGGTGTVLEPYQISNARQLDAMRDFLSFSFKLTSNINLSYNKADQNIYPDNIGWLPIGDSEQPFTGTFNGDGYTISGLTIKREDSSYLGLFGYVSQADHTDPNISNVVVKTKEIIGKDYVGALVGYGININLQNVYVTTDLTGEDYVGGLVGYATTSLLEVVSSSGNISSTGNHTGGIVGFLDGNLTHSYNEASITGSTDYGGLIGELNGHLENAFNMGMLIEGTEVNNVGGLVGNLNGGINNCYNVGIFDLATTSLTIGLIVGNNNFGIITNSYYYNPYDFTNNLYGTVLTKEELFNYESYVGFDFTNDWEVLTDHLLPTLQDVSFEALTSFDVADSLDVILSNPYHKVINITKNPSANSRHGYIFMSSDEEIFKVEKNGELTPVSLGTATVTVYSIELNSQHEIEINVVQGVKGDVNGDFEASITDLVILRCHLAELQSISEEFIINADINTDNSINITDPVILRRYLAGLEDL